MPSLITFLELLMQNCLPNCVNVIFFNVSETILNGYGFDHELKSIGVDHLGRTPDCLKHFNSHEQLFMCGKEYKSLSLFSMIFSLI